MTPASPPIPATEVEPGALHAAFGRAFADYVAGPFHLPLAAWAGFLARQGVDPALSRVLRRGDEPIAFALVAPRPARRRWRVATMGAVPEARGSGAADALLADVIARAAAAGMAALELEVFAQNERASRLYARHGFVPRVALHAHAATGAADEGAALPPPVPAEAALAWLDRAEAEVADLPLQVAAHALATAPPGWQAHQRGRAQLAWSLDAEGTVQVRSLVDLDPAQQDAQALACGLAAQHPGATLVVPPLQRPDLGGEALERAGWVRQPLWQWMMVRVIDPAATPQATPA